MLKFDKSKLASSKVGNIVTLNYTDADVFESGTEISAKNIKEVEDYRKEYIDKAAEFASKYAKDLMVKDKGVDKVVFNMPFSTSKKGTLDISINRSKTFKNIKDKSGPDIVKSKIIIAVKDPFSKGTEKTIKALEAELTSALVK